MCSINGTCGCRGTLGVFLGELVWKLAVALLRGVWVLAKLTLAGLIALTRWAAPRTWRLTVRGSRAVWARVRPVGPVIYGGESIRPQRAVTDLPDGHLRLPEWLKDKKAANG